jgi:ElaB/YqjD/DUF883 family membrane-anchored ribosome-binding protein
VNRLSFAPVPLLPILLLGLASASCASTSHEVNTLKAVDDLVGRIEFLHFEVELAKARAENALDSLTGLASGEFRGDPVEAFEQLVAAIELCEDQAEKMRDSVRPMHAAAEKVFTQWTADAAELRIDSLRERSLARLGETRTRYQAILTSLDSACKALATFNIGLRDHATYLEHDFNPASVAAIQPEIESLARWSEELDLRLDACMAAAARYVEASALPGTVQVAQGPKS